MTPAANAIPPLARQKKILSAIVAHQKTIIAHTMWRTETVNTSGLASRDTDGSALSTFFQYRYTDKITGGTIASGVSVSIMPQSAPMPKNIIMLDFSTANSAKRIVATVPISENISGERTLPALQTGPEKMKNSVPCSTVRIAMRRPQLVRRIFAFITPGRQAANRRQVITVSIPSDTGPSHFKTVIAASTPNLPMKNERILSQISEVVCAGGRTFAATAISSQSSGGSSRQLPTAQAKTATPRPSAQTNNRLMSFW